MGICIYDHTMPKVIKHFNEAFLIRIRMNESHKITILLSSRNDLKYSLRSLTLLQQSSENHPIIFFTIIDTKTKYTQRIANNNCLWTTATMFSPPRVHLQFGGKKADSKHLYKQNSSGKTTSGVGKGALLLNKTNRWKGKGFIEEKEEGRFEF